MSILMQILARYAKLGDVSQLLEIEKDGFPTNNYVTSFKRDITNNHISIIVAADEVSQDRDIIHTSASKLQLDEASDPRIFNQIYRFFLRTVFGENYNESYEPLSAYVATWFMADQAHITGIAVRGTHRGHGIGELMLISSIKEAIRRCSSVVTLEVRVSNNVAQSLYSKYGFKEMGLRKRYYVDNHEDAYIMTTDSITSAEYISMMDSLVDQYISRYPEVRLIGG